MKEQLAGCSESIEHADFVQLAESLLALPLISVDPKLRARVLVLCQVDEVLTGYEVDLRRAVRMRESQSADREALAALTYLWLCGVDGLLNDLEQRRWALDVVLEAAKGRESEDYVDVKRLVPEDMRDVARRVYEEPDFCDAIEKAHEQLHRTRTLLEYILDYQDGQEQWSGAEHAGRSWIDGGIDPATGAVYLKSFGFRRGELTRREVTRTLRQSMHIVPVVSISPKRRVHRITVG